jgi:hypothetical protein
MIRKFKRKFNKDSCRTHASLSDSRVHDLSSVQFIAFLHDFQSSHWGVFLKFKIGCNLVSLLLTLK